jgi:maltose-binding protein MalE
MKLRPFELALIVVFGTLFVVALILLRTYEAAPEENETAIGSIAIWGTLPSTGFDEMLKLIRQVDKGFDNVTYRYIPPEDFDDEFVNALADQKAPDLLLLTHDRLVKHRIRLQALSYDVVPIRDFRTTYIDGAEIFALEDGVYAFPVAVDPLVMYWNKDIFADKGILIAPQSWEVLVAETVPTFTERDFNRSIVQASVAMGEYQNIKNAFPILSLLLLQGGSALVTEEKKSV